MDEVDLVNEVSVVKAGEVVDEVGVDEAYDQSEGDAIDDAVVVVNVQGKNIT